MLLTYPYAIAYYFLIITTLPDSASSRLLKVLSATHSSHSSILDTFCNASSATLQPIGEAAKAISDRPSGASRCAVDRIPNAPSHCPDYATD